MNLLPKSKEEFSQQEYWNLFFKKRGNEAFEWYGEYPELSGYLHKYLKKQDDILITGCGNSTLGKDLYDMGCSKVTNIDISKVVIKQMLSQQDKDRPGLQYLQMDALQTTFANDQFSAVIDKEIQRLLRLGGRYICISLLQEHILHKILDYFPSNGWMLRIVRCFEPEIKSIENGENSLPVFMIICTKFTALPRKILEICLGSNNKIDKCETCNDVISSITSIQRAAFICSSLRKSSIENDGEISLDLYEPGDQSNVKFSVHIVEIPFVAKNAPYACFIVPQGRETEWLFSTKAGRQNLAAMTNYNRLAIVSMHRGKVYGTLDEVKKELEDIVCNLAPKKLKSQKIAFLSLGATLGKRNIRYEGKSTFSGEYVIEDVEHDSGDIYRRLFYLNAQLVTQSEAKLKQIKSKGKKSKYIVDLFRLMCQHHMFMSIGAHLACAMKQNAKVTVLGLGGGGLCSFLHKLLPQAFITGVDIDPEMLKIATEWFGFKEDEKLSAKIQDGLEYICDLAKNGEKVDAILCDVDNKNSEIGMSCPPKEFLSPDILKAVSNSLTNQGLFVVNVVLRDKSLRPSVIKDLQNHFRSFVSYNTTEDLNEIFICANTGSDFTGNIKIAIEAINSFFRKNNVNEVAELSEYMDHLKIN
ncbi:hypothetical protein GWI33_016957 [Rhynchophorus ferrugineus]|uniref:Methyltransferase domain-containing protein n=1 Tax=Rhynchophorus ferrugineus TaxID=354439 RepID=A0A834I038_RHYFE|nr:hypothetical protein GWI33_016957 [Rhynchophorus ferrugineus]